MKESRQHGARKPAPGFLQSPRVHPTATVVDSELGAWTDVGDRASLIETVLGDYSYVERDCQVIYTHIGKFCSIAACVRINPVKHPLGRAALHHRCRGPGQKPARERFPERIQEGLMRIAWWEWPWERLHRALSDFRTLEVEAFVEKYDTAPKTACKGGEKLA